MELSLEINYKGFIGKVLFSADVDAFYGEVLNSHDLIVFQASHPHSIQEAMQNAVDCYLTYLADKEKFSSETIAIEGLVI
jgi:predicted HicB family RNase H-like nuclease